ncbi:hypothetical protein KK056_21065, partial [Enterobacter kobei]|nr:hypothetical protein [Enterobacter kobei]MBT1941476.1 hypothetical protein [Enterobacter hormaechei subsp. hoffmannii]MBT2074975.1 hypothetical protein [Enterobacter hormaechei subsp. hoffmannii]MDE9651357.1 hypothetical protein [Citrobacter portucalensis]
ELLLCHGTVCVVGKMRDLILQLSKSSIYSTKPHRSKTQLNEDRFLSRMPPICGYAVQALYLSVRKHSAERHLQIH